MGSGIESTSTTGGVALENPSQRPGNSSPQGDLTGDEIFPGPIGPGSVFEGSSTGSGGVDSDGFPILGGGNHSHHDHDHHPACNHSDHARCIEEHYTCKGRSCTNPLNLLTDLPIGVELPPEVSPMLHLKTFQELTILLPSRQLRTSQTSLPSLSPSPPCRICRRS